VNITEKQVKQIDKTYDYTLKILRKDFFSNNYAGLNLFIEYLRYIRDKIIINSNSLDEKLPENFLAASITTAIAEFEAYENYHISNANKQLQNFHWNNFWELVKQNLEEWLSFNASV
jgi:hypothetical protein